MQRTTLFVIAVTMLFAAVRTDEMYSDKYDNIDIDAYLANDEIRNKYYNCFMDKGECSVDAAFFKGKILIEQL